MSRRVLVTDDPLVLAKRKAPPPYPKGRRAQKVGGVDLDGMSWIDLNPSPTANTPKRKRRAAPVRDIAEPAVSKDKKSQTRSNIDPTKTSSNEQSDSSLSTSPKRKRGLAPTNKRSSPTNSKGKKPQGYDAVSAESQLDIESVLSARKELRALKHDMDKIQAEIPGLMNEIETCKWEKNGNGVKRASARLTDVYSRRMAVNKEYGVAKRQAESMFHDWRKCQGDEDSLQDGTRLYKEMIWEDDLSGLLASGSVNAKGLVQVLNAQKQQLALARDWRASVVESERLKAHVLGPNRNEAGVASRYRDAILHELAPRRAFTAQEDQAKELLKLWSKQQTVAIEAEGDPSAKVAMKKAVLQALRLHKAMTADSILPQNDSMSDPMQPLNYSIPRPIQPHNDSMPVEMSKDQLWEHVFKVMLDETPPEAQNADEPIYGSKSDEQVWEETYEAMMASWTLQDQDANEGTCEGDADAEA